MRIELQLDHVQVRGEERIEDPTHWPVFFAADDAPLLALAGDVDASAWMQAPGAAPTGSVLSWQYRSGPRPPSSMWIGYALMFTVGGAKDPKALAAYASLQADVYALVTSHAARLAGLAPLLAAFGGAHDVDGGSRPVDLDRLRKGIDPERLRDEIDKGLVEQFEFFREVGGLLRGEKVARREPASRPSEPESPSPNTGGRLAPGTVVAVTVQIWPFDEIPLDGPLEFDRPLPARQVARASLRLSGRLWREP